MNAHNWATDMATHTNLIPTRQYGPVTGVCNHCGETCGEVDGSVHLATRLDTDSPWLCFTVKASGSHEPMAFTDFLRALSGARRTSAEWVEL